MPATKKTITKATETRRGAVQDPSKLAVSAQPLNAWDWRDEWGTDERSYDDDGAREWESLDDAPLEDDVADMDLPLDARPTLSARFFDETTSNTDRRARYASAGLLDTFVKARLAATPELMRGPARRVRNEPRVVQVVGSRAAS